MNHAAVNPRDSERLAQTRTFRDDGWKRWRGAELYVIGCGLLGQRVGFEAALAEAHVVCFDFDFFAAENAQTQWGQLGVAKVDHLVRRAEPYAPGRVLGVRRDIRNVGIGRLARAAVLVDCTDDPSLAVPLTRISNGLGTPLLRGALAGDGQQELGRVACSHGVQHSCQLCNHSVDDLLRPTRRQPCAGEPVPQREPTRAGGAIGMAIAGLLLLQAQRLVTGNDLDLVLDREWIVDLTHGQLLPLRRQRSQECLSGHVRWTMTPIDLRASHASLVDVFSEAARRFDLKDSAEVTLEFYGHPLCREFVCSCGEFQRVAGTPWLPAVHCRRCGAAMTPQLATALDWLTEANVRELGIRDCPLAQLGMPDDGAMVIARAPNRKPIRLLLADNETSLGTSVSPHLNPAETRS